jgi:NitT/TauT family transport system substrate-binding protein
MTLPGHPVASARDFVGKRVGIHHYGDPLYRLFLHRAGVDPARVTMVFVDDDVGRLVRGEVDLMQGYAIEELVKLRRQVGPGAGFISFRELGFNAYSQVVFMTAAQLQAHGENGRAFVRGLRAGWAYAAAHPEEAVEAVERRLAPGADRGLLRSMLQATLPYVAAPGREALAPMDAAKWSGMSAAAAEMGLISRAEDPAAFLASPPP